MSLIKQTPGTLDVEMIRGDHFDIFFRVRQRVYDPLANDGAGGYVAGDYVNLTGYTVQAQIRETAISGTVISELIAVIPPDAEETRGSVLLSLPKTASEALPLDPLIGISTFVWDVQLTNPSGEPRTYLGGTWKASADVTRA